MSAVKWWYVAGVGYDTDCVIGPFRSEIEADKLCAELSDALDADDESRYSVQPMTSPRTARQDFL